jgi:hypothetical protein
MRALLVLSATALLGRPALAQRAAPEGRVVTVLRGILGNARDTRYAHVTHVDEARGRYHFDCSGMARWVLHRATPDAQEALERGLNTRRPLARDYHAWFQRLPPGTGGRAWRAVSRGEDLRPGDVIAWVFPPQFHLAITGHVVFAMARPRRVSPRILRIQIADSTSNPHDEDTRSRAGRTGPGQGVIDLEVDPRSGALTGYRWSHRPGAGLLRVPINAARPLR